MGIFDRTERTVLGSPLGPTEGGGMDWSTPIDAHVTVSADASWDIGANGAAIRTIVSHFQEMYDAAAYFYMDNLAGQYLQFWVTDPATSSYGPVAVNAVLEFLGSAGIVNSQGEISIFSADSGIGSGDIWITTGSDGVNASGNIRLKTETTAGTRGKVLVDALFLNPVNAGTQSLGDVGAAWGALYVSQIDGDGSDIDVFSTLRPDTTLAHDLGSLTLRWASIFSGGVNVANDTYITARNGANSANINLIKATTSNYVMIGDETAVPLVWIKSTGDVFIQTDATNGSRDFDVRADTLTLDSYGAQATLKLLSTDQNGYTGFKAPAVSLGDVIYTLPTSDASSAGQAFLSDGAGNLSWSAGFNIESTGRAVFGNAEKHSAVNVTTAGAFAVSATTHRTLFCWPTAAAAAINLNLPPGENGLEFIIKDVEGGAGVNNITFVPDGSDSVEAGMDITTNWGARHIQYNSTNNTWFIVGT